MTNIIVTRIWYKQEIFSVMPCICISLKKCTLNCKLITKTTNALWMKIVQICVPNQIINTLRVWQIHLQNDKLLDIMKNITILLDLAFIIHNKYYCWMWIWHFHCENQITYTHLYICYFSMVDDDGDEDYDIDDKWE